MVGDGRLPCGVDRGAAFKPFYPGPVELLIPITEEGDRDEDDGHPKEDHGVCGAPER